MDLQVSVTSSSRLFCLFNKVSLVWLLHRTSLYDRVAILGTLCGTFLNTKHVNFHVRQTQQNDLCMAILLFLQVCGTFLTLINVKVTFIKVKNVPQSVPSMTTFTHLQLARGIHQIHRTLHLRGIYTNLYLYSEVGR